MPSDNSIGVACGNMMLTNTLKSPAPSINAASAYSHGIAEKKFLKSRKLNPKPPALIRNTPQNVLSKCRLSINLYVIVTDPIVGTTKVIIAIPVINFLTLKSYFATIYPEIAGTDTDNTLRRR